MKFFTRTETPSPCVGICAVDFHSGLCKGCLRSLDEIREWSAYSERQKRKVVDQLAKRRKTIQPPKP